MGDGSRPSQDPLALGRFGEAGSEVEAGTSAFRGIWLELQEGVRSGQEIPLSLRARARSVGAHAVDWSLQATLRVFQAAGSRAIFDDNPLQRALRDLIAIRAHAMNNSDKSGSMRAREALGSLGREIFL